MDGTRHRYEVEIDRDEDSTDEERATRVYYIAQMLAISGGRGEGQRCPVRLSDSTSSFL